MKSWIKASIAGAIVVIVIVGFTVPFVILYSPSATNTEPPDGTAAATTPSTVPTTPSTVLTTASTTLNTETAPTTTTTMTTTTPCPTTATTESTVPTTTVPPPRCSPKGALAKYGRCQEDTTGRCYCIYQPLQPNGWVWSNAAWYCSNTSMSLVSLESSAEEQFLATFASEGEFWISAKRTSSTLDWTWTSTGASLSYSNWAIPDFANQLGCASFKISSGLPALWFVNDCSGAGSSPHYWFVCEDSSSVPPAPSGCPSNTYDYANYMTWYPGVTLDNKLYCFSSHWTQKDAARFHCGQNLRPLSLQNERKNDIIMKYIVDNNLDRGGGFWTSGFCDSVKWQWQVGPNQYVDVTYSLLDSSDSLSTCGTGTDFYSLWISAEKRKWFSNMPDQYRQVICEAP